jgi:methionyl-tRNA formyltransferase
VARIGRVAYLATGSFGVPLLPPLAAAAGQLLVVSQPDRPAGRGLASRSSPVAAAAREMGVRVMTPIRLRSEEATAALAEFDPDGILLASYGQLVPGDILSLAPRPPLNVHPSLLPRHRGAAPVAGTILAGDHEGGLTLMVMIDRLDAGPIVDQWRVPLTGREQSPELEERLARLAAEVVPPVLERWATGALVTQPQNEEAATMTRPFTRADGWIDWRRSADEIDRQVRALQPWPGAWTTLEARRLHIRRARPVEQEENLPAGSLSDTQPPAVACGRGTLWLETVQPQGRAAMSADAWRRGLRGAAIRLGAERPD